MLYFPEASEESKAVGWNFDFGFLNLMLNEANVRDSVSPDDLDALLCVLNAHVADQVKPLEEAHIALCQAAQLLNQGKNHDAFRVIRVALENPLWDQALANLKEGSLEPEKIEQAANPAHAPVPLTSDQKDSL